MPPDLLRRFQARFLRELFRSPGSGFVLKGGLALNALYGSSRLTMDIDLDFPPHGERTADSLHAQLRRAIQTALSGIGIRDARTSEPRKIEISPKWKLSGTAPDGSPFNVRIEVSRRPPIPAGPVRQHALRSQLMSGLPVFYVDVYDEPTLAAMKLAATLSPTRHAPRDVYDLDLLIAHGHRPDMTNLRTLLAARRMPDTDLAEVLRAKLDALQWSDFESQVLPSMEPPEAGRLNAREWEAMKQRVGDAALQWLRALEESPT